MKKEFNVRTPFSSEIGDVFYLNAPQSGLLFLHLITVQL